MRFPKKLVVFIAVVIGGLVISLFVLFNYHTTKRTTSGFTSEALRPYLKNGDIICRLGDRLWSLYFKDLSPDDKRYSHLGIIRINGDDITVINAEGARWEGKDYVNETLLQDFISAAKTIGIYRLKNLSGDAITEKALHFVGLPFDWDFDMEDSRKLYCTELLYAILKDMDTDVKLKTVFQKELKVNIIPLESISHSPDFMEIICLYD
jgi:hypothetical protein